MTHFTFDIPHILRNNVVFDNYWMVIPNRFQLSLYFPPAYGL